MLGNHSCMQLGMWMPLQGTGRGLRTAYRNLKKKLIVFNRNLGFRCLGFSIYGMSSESFSSGDELESSPFLS